MKRLPYPHDNWTEFESGDCWARDIEGRSSHWMAAVRKKDDGFTATVIKEEQLKGRAALKAAFSLNPPEPRRVWILGPFDSATTAREVVEKYISTRSNPGTWRGKWTPEIEQVLSMAREVSPAVLNGQGQDTETVSGSAERCAGDTEKGKR